MEPTLTDVAEKLAEIGQAVARAAVITNDDEMNRALLALRDLRENATKANSQVTAARKRFEEENAVALESAKQLAGMVATFEGVVRQYAVSRYQADPQIGKAPFAGVGIGAGTEIAYSAKEALAWAIEHKQCLALNTKEFNDLCKIASLRPAFVTETEKITAKIATDLAKALAEQKG